MLNTTDTFYQLFFRAVLGFCFYYKEWIIGFLVTWYMFRCYRVKNSPIKIASNGIGEFFVSRKSIITLIQNTGDSMHSGRIKRVLLNDKKRVLEIKLQIVLKANQSFDVISSQYQERVKNAVEEFLGASKEVHIDVILKGIEKTPAIENIQVPPSPLVANSLQTFRENVSEAITNDKQ